MVKIRVKQWGKIGCISGQISKEGNIFFFFLDSWHTKTIQISIYIFVTNDLPSS